MGYLGGDRQSLGDDCRVPLQEAFPRRGGTVRGAEYATKYLINSLPTVFFLGEIVLDCRETPLFPQHGDLLLE